MTTSTADQNDAAPPSATGGSGSASTRTNRYAVAATASHTAYRARTRTAPSGRTAMAVASTPAATTNGARGRSSAREAASAMTTISKVAQPTHCTRLTTVGSAEARRPSRPRSSTIAGTRSRADGAAVSPSSAPPRTAPTTTAATVTASGRPGRTTKAAATGSSRLMPRLPNRPAVSRSPSAASGGSARVSGASPAGRADGTTVLIAAPYAGITRSGSDGRRHVQPPSQPGRSRAPACVRRSVRRVGRDRAPVGAALPGLLCIL